VRTASIALLSLVLASWAAAGTREVSLSLPLKPKLALTGRERIYLGPFLREAAGDEAGPKLRFDVAAEFDRYLRRLLRKETKLNLLPALPDVEPPTLDTLELPKRSDFWRELGRRSGADYIVAGSIDFRVEDRSGYKTEEYTSPLDGRTYYRQVMVEQTGFTYDILLLVLDARTGQPVLEEPLKDFQERQERSFDEFTGMFANLFALENQLIGIFVPRTVKSKRVIFTP